MHTAIVILLGLWLVGCFEHKPKDMSEGNWLLLALFIFNIW